MDENLEYNLKPSELLENSKIDVKNKKFDKLINILNNIIYNGKQFYLDSHQKKNILQKLIIDVKTIEKTRE